MGWTSPSKYRLGWYVFTFFCKHLRQIQLSCVCFRALFQKAGENNQRFVHFANKNRGPGHYQPQLLDFQRITTPKWNITLATTDSPIRLGDMNLASNKNFGLDVQGDTWSFWKWGPSSKKKLPPFFLEIINFLRFFFVHPKKNRKNHRRSESNFLQPLQKGNRFLRLPPAEGSVFFFQLIRGLMKGPGPLRPRKSPENCPNETTSWCLVIHYIYIYI